MNADIVNEKNQPRKSRIRFKIWRAVGRTKGVRWIACRMYDLHWNDFATWQEAVDYTNKLAR